MSVSEGIVRAKFRTNENQATLSQCEPIRFFVCPIAHTKTLVTKSIVRFSLSIRTGGGSLSARSRNVICEEKKVRKKDEQAFIGLLSLRLATCYYQYYRGTLHNGTTNIWRVAPQKKLESRFKGLVVRQ